MLVDKDWNKPCHLSGSEAGENIQRAGICAFDCEHPMVYAYTTRVKQIFSSLLSGVDIR